MKFRHLETISHEAKIPPKSQTNFGEVALATIAVCLRYGTHFAVLADQAKPLWRETEQEEISMLSDGEMKRINIEASAALAEWIELMRADDKHFRKIVKAAQSLPMTPLFLDEKTNQKRYYNMIWCNSDQSRQRLFEYASEKFGNQWMEQQRVDYMSHNTRRIANGIISAYWRNGSDIEDIHAGKWSARPLQQRRITPLQERSFIFSAGNALSRC